MNTRIQKIIVAIGLAALCLSAAHAGSFSQSVSTAGSGSWSGTVNVPNAGNCTQFWQGFNNWQPYHYDEENNYFVPERPASVVTVTGPLGSDTLIGQTQKFLQRPISGGTYSIVLSVQNGGAAVVGISW